MRMKSPCGEAAVALLNKDQKARSQDPFSGRFQVLFVGVLESGDTAVLNLLNSVYLLVGCAEV